MLGNDGISFGSSASFLRAKLNALFNADISFLTVDAEAFSSSVRRCTYAARREAVMSTARAVGPKYPSRCFSACPMRFAERLLFNACPPFSRRHSRCKRQDEDR